MCGFLLLLLLLQQRLKQQAEKQKEKKTDPSVNRQQSLMASWLRRPASQPTGAAGDPHRGPQGPRGPLPSPTAKGAPLVLVLDEEEQAGAGAKTELRKAAELEAAAWRAAAEDKEGFVAAVEGLANCMSPRSNPKPSDRAAPTQPEGLGFRDFKF